MWCATCRQDVPAVSAPEGEVGRRCVRCGSVMKTTSPPPGEPLLAHHYEDENLGRIIVDCPIDLDDWTLDADLRAVDRLLTTLGKKLRMDSAPQMGSYMPPSAMTWNTIPVQSNQASPMIPTSHAQAMPTTSSARPSVMSWFVLCTSLVAFACGAVLIGWAYLGGRNDLWAMGLPCALVGQAGLIVGLMLQIQGNSSQPSQAPPANYYPVNASQQEPMVGASHFPPTMYHGGGQQAYVPLSKHELQRHMDSLSQRMQS